MGKPTHGKRRIGYFERMQDYLNHGENVPRGQVRPEHGGSQTGMMTPHEVINKIAKGKGDDFPSDYREFASKLVDRY